MRITIAKTDVEVRLWSYGRLDILLLGLLAAQREARKLPSILRHYISSCDECCNKRSQSQGAFRPCKITQGLREQIQCVT